MTAQAYRSQAKHRKICCIAPQAFTQYIFFSAKRCPANFSIWHDARLPRRTMNCSSLPGRDSSQPEKTPGRQEETPASQNKTPASREEASASQEDTPKSISRASPTIYIYRYVPKQKPKKWHPLHLVTPRDTKGAQDPRKDHMEAKLSPVMVILKHLWQFPNRVCDDFSEKFYRNVD